MSTVFDYASHYAVMLDYGSEMSYFARDKACLSGKVLSHVKVANWRVLSSDNVINAEDQLKYLLHHYWSELQCAAQTLTRCNNCGL
jgi:hypothetical protein